MSLENGRLAERVALVTGAGSGIGEAILDALVDEGAYAVGTGTRRSSVEAINQRVGERGFGMLLDLRSDPKEISDVIERMMWGIAQERAPAGTEPAAKMPIEILVNNAGTRKKSDGTTTDGPTMKMWGEDGGANVTEVLDVNLRGTMLVTNQVVREALRVENFRVISIGSAAARGHGYQTNYAASKAGLRGYMQSLTAEQGQKGGPRRSASFNTLEPGLVRTPLTQDLREEVFEGAEQATPIGRLVTPQEIARTVVWLALPESGYINGAVIPVDGGATTGIRL